MADEPIEYGRFDVGTIERVSDGFLFRDLMTPRGTWSNITLADKLFQDEEGKTLNQDFDGWVDVNKKGGENGFVVMPADIRYALMAVTDLKKDDRQLGETASTLYRHVWNDDCWWLHPYNATSIDYRVGQDAIVTHGAGLPTNHPLYHQQQALIVQENGYLTDKATSLVPTLEAIFHTNDVLHIRNILGKVYFQTLDATSTFWRRSDDSTLRFPVVYGLDKGVVYVDTVGLFPINGPARGVRVDPKDFHPF